MSLGACQPPSAQKIWRCHNISPGLLMMVIPLFVQKDQVAPKMWCVLVGAERGLLWVCQKKSRRLGYLEFDRFWGVSHRVDVSPINPAKMTSWFEEVQKLWPPTPKPSKQFGGFDWGQSQEPLRISTWGFHHSISHGRIDKVHLSHFLGK
jgi:hypothetical protein